MDVCTIIAKNYVAAARVLARSFARHHPDGRFHVLVIDDADGYIDPTLEPFEVVTPDQVGIDEFDRMTVLYDILELSTAVKPWLLRYLLRSSAQDAVVYLDPDMRLYAPLDELFALVKRYGLVLSPHNLDPIPRDGFKPDEQDILSAGVYNLGFIGIGAGGFADRLLDWWSERLATDCIVAPEHGLFVDQRWIDLVPGMAESFHILRDPGFNVAYWNLATRPVSERDGRWFVKGDAPLRLFHFSGYDVRRPQLVSRHQNRIRLGDDPDLARLFADYAAELRAEGIEESREWPYTYAATASGTPLGSHVRRLYRELVLEGFDGSLLDFQGEAAFLEAANAPALGAGGGRGVTRYLELLYEARRDLREAYPDLDGPAGDELVRWAHESGRPELSVPDVLLPPAPAPRTRPPAPEPEPEEPPRAPFGVNVAGYLNAELGVGEVARQAIGALDAAGVPVLPIGVPAPSSRQRHAFAARAASAYGYPVSLVCVNADMLPGFARAAGTRFFDGRHTIGWWWWELSVFPERLHAAFGHVDELWAGSRFVARALSAVSPVPVLRMPMPVSFASPPQPARGALGLPDGFLVLFTWDYNSIAQRKNPRGALEAFLRAFPDPDEGATLVLKCVNAEQHVDQHERVRLAAEAAPHVRLIDSYLDAGDKDRLLASCDCYLSLHRSEGFGIGMAEAMLLGKPVVATAYSGNLDFMTAANSYLVEHTLAPVGPGADPYWQDDLWAEPDLDHAAAQLRSVFEDPEEAAARGRRAASDIVRKHSPAVAGATMERRLRAIGAGRRHGPPAGGDEPDVAARVTSLEEEHGRLAAHALAVETSVLREQRGVARRVIPLQDGVAGLAVGLDAVENALDAVRHELGAHRRALQTGALIEAPAVVAAAGYEQVAALPWTHEYNDAHRAFVARELDDPALLETFRAARPLPPRFGIGLDERVVEFPWVAAQDLSGTVLDAGSTLNHAHVLARLRPRCDRLDIVTLAPEPVAFPQLGISYLYADLRELPLVSERYDRVVSISTLEHVGLDVSHFGARAEPADPQAGLLLALAELHRVLKPGGDLYLTLPIGRGERYEWVRSLTLEELAAAVERFAPARLEESFFLYGGEGWQRVEREATRDARYRDHLTAPPPGDDRGVAAYAVACLRLVK